MGIFTKWEHCTIWYNNFGNRKLTIIPEGSDTKEKEYSNYYEYLALKEEFLQHGWQVEKENELEPNPTRIITPDGSADLRLRRKIR
jgi:hypothetical protein